MKYLYIYVFTTCVLPWSPWFGDKQQLVIPKPEPVEDTAGYLCDCGWRKYYLWHDVTVSPFNNLEPF